MRSSKKKALMVTLGAILMVVTIGITYAFITQTLTGTKKVVITAGTLSLVLDEKNEITITDALPMYDEVGMIQDEVFNFSLINDTTVSTDYVLKLAKIDADNELSTSSVKYYFTKEGVGEPALLSTLPEDGTIDHGTIAGNDTINYTLRLWVDASIVDNSAISGKSLSYKIVVEGSMTEQLVYAKSSSELVSDTINLGENCKTYDDSVDTFLVGQCSQNYVWYSGKLWRAVLKNNETGAVKMVTDNTVTAISYNEDYNSVFDGGYVDQWLNQEFLPTLHDYENYLVENSIWDATEIKVYDSRPSYATSVTRTVGLLNLYEYETTYAKSDDLATYSTGYLNSNLWWWLMSPYSTTTVHCAINDGSHTSCHPSSSYGVRPFVNLKSGIQILGGTGTQADPYILEGDVQEPVNGTTLLSTRYSGEYITFNNELYRIVDIENGLTKIIAVDKPGALYLNAFDSANVAVSFAEASIKTDLESYYQGLASSNADAYNMIEPNTTWYLGAVGDPYSNLEETGNYKASICVSIDATTSMNECTEKATSTTANIGLPRMGEMFASHITRGEKSYFWTLTPYSTSYVRAVITNGIMSKYAPKNTFGVRPSMYLKSGVKIANDNTGNGTYEKPYTIELGA